MFINRKIYVVIYTLLKLFGSECFRKYELRVSFTLTVKITLYYSKLAFFLAFSFQRQLQDFQHIFDKMKFDAFLHIGRNVFHIFAVPTG